MSEGFGESGGDDDDDDDAAAEVSASEETHMSLIHSLLACLLARPIDCSKYHREQRNPPPAVTAY